jgi:hypothetical protein
MRPYFKNTHYKKGEAEWLKGKALSSSPSTVKKKEKKKESGKHDSSEEIRRHNK